MGKVNSQPTDICRLKEKGWFGFNDRYNHLGSDQYLGTVKNKSYSNNNTDTNSGCGLRKQFCFSVNIVYILLGWHLRSPSPNFLIGCNSIFFCVNKMLFWKRGARNSTSKCLECLCNNSLGICTQTSNENIL